MITAFARGADRDGPGTPGAIIAPAGILVLHLAISGTTIPCSARFARPSMASSQQPGRSAVAHPKDLESLRTDIGRRYDDLSPRLKQVAKYVLDHPYDVALQTLAVIANRCKVQPSTIVRFAKTFGYEGASDIQKLFRDEILN